MKKLLFALVALMAATLVIGIAAAIVMRPADIETEAEAEGAEEAVTA